VLTGLDLRPAQKRVKDNADKKIAMVNGYPPLVWAELHLFTPSATLSLVIAAPFCDLGHEVFPWSYK
jgi:hypothetical protein